MRILFGYLLSALTAAGLLAAQGHGGGGHHGESGSGFTHYSPAITPYSPAITHYSPAIGFTGTTSHRMIGPAPQGSRPQDAGFPPISSGVYGNQYRRGWPANGTGINRTIRKGDHDRDGFGRSYYPVLVAPFFGYGYGYGDNFYDSRDSQQNAPNVESGPPQDYAPYGQYAPEENPGPAAAPGYYYPPVPYSMTAPQAAPEPAPPATPVTLVLKSGQKLEVQSYAIMNGTLWDFTKQNSRRIRLADIDKPASAKATEDAGGSFPEESFAVSPN